MNNTLSYLIGFILTGLLFLFLRPVAERVGLVDHPGDRRAHSGVVPLLGGVSMFMAFAVSAMTLPIALYPFRALFAGAFVLVMVGLLDDLREVSSTKRFAAQFVAALMMIFGGGISLNDMGAIGPGGTPLELGMARIPLTVFCALGVINAMNMVDGVDGLSGGLALVALLGMALFVGDGHAGPLLFLLSSVVASFLAFNMRLPWQGRARVFMGDAGSLFLGFVLAWFLIGLTQGPARAMPPVLSLYLFAIPLMDTVWLLFRRLFQRRSPFQADFQHLHHMLQMLGLSPGTTTWLILCLAMGLAGLGGAGLATGISELRMFQLFLAIVIIYSMLKLAVWEKGRFLIWPLERRLLLQERRDWEERRRGDRRENAERRREEERRT